MSRGEHKFFKIKKGDSVILSSSIIPGNERQVVEVYDNLLRAGAKVYDLDDKAIKKWQALARETAWKDYAAKSPNCARLLQLAEKTI